MMLMLQIAGGVILAPIIVLVICSIIDGFEEMMRWRPQRRPPVVLQKKYRDSTPIWADSIKAIKSLKAKLSAQARRNT